jgi:hypothetical protein
MARPSDSTLVDEDITTIAVTIITVAAGTNALNFTVSRERFNLQSGWPLFFSHL